MKILGVSLSTIILIALVVFIVRKWGNSIPVVRDVG
jgi:hypothetical protein